MNRSCTYANALKEKPGQNMFMLLGFGAFIAVVFMIVYFLGERTGIFPLVQVIQLEALTEGENWILFITAIFLIFTFGVLLIGIILYHSFKRQCKKQLKSEETTD